MGKEYSDNTIISAQRRVLRLVDGYLAKQPDALTSDGKGLMTLGDIRHHIQGALSLKRTKGKRHG